MSDGAETPLYRRRLLRVLGASAAASGLAGCSGDGDDGADGDSGGDDGGGEDGGSGGGPGTPEPTPTREPTASQSPTPGPTATQSPTRASTPTATAEQSPDDGGGSTPTATPASASTPTPTGTPSDDEVTADVSLRVRESRSNVGEFETLQTTFEAIELVPTSGDAVRLDDETRDIDLTEVGPGGTVDLFETTLPPGSYEEGRLFLPIQEAELAGGGDPEFSNTVPATRQLGFSDPLALSAGDTIDFTVIVALLRIGGDGPWTYTIGFRTAWN